MWFALQLGGGASAALAGGSQIASCVLLPGMVAGTLARAVSVLVVSCHDTP